MHSRFKTILGAILIAIAAGLAGWILGANASQPTVNNVFLNSIHEVGYSLMDPILVCAGDQAATADQGAQAVINSAVSTEVSKGNVVTASVYYRRFFDNSWALYNGNETYYPASLNKVPLMIAYYNWVEETDFSLQRRIYFPPGLNENAQQEIQPVHPIQPGQSYSADELINAMIKDSDNNATMLLFSEINSSTLEGVFNDLGVPFLAEGQSPINYMNVSQYAFFFRVLYNGTYLSHADSQRALAVLSQTTFNDGLMAGVPSRTTVVHKFGLVSVAPNNTVITARELHDCGIVYPMGKNPYLICVMTKSTGSLQGAEQAIGDISKAVYQYVNK